MKTLIFLFFTYITYVLSSVAGPLGFAAKMPPFESLRHEEHSLKHQSISGHYDQKDLLLFLLGGYTGDCTRHLKRVCEEIKDVYNTVYYFGQGLGALCDNPHKACKMYSEFKEKLCDYKIVRFYSYPRESASYMNTAKCRNIYTKCRLRSASCSPEYKAYCQNILALCNVGYRDYKLRHLFVDLAGNYTDPKFIEKLKEPCTELYDLSNGFVQYCLNYKWLISDLELSQKLKERGLADFEDYPDLSSAALLEARGLDGKLFTPRTSSPLDPAYMMAFLVGQIRSARSFRKLCLHVSNKCLGLKFFSHTQYFCKTHSVLPKINPCGDADETIMKKEVPSLKKKLDPLRKTLDAAPKMPYRLEVDVEMCLKYLGPCSYLRGLDLTLTGLCRDLESQCAQALETGSALSIFELSMRDLVPLHKPEHEQDPCELGLREMCNKIANDTADFLAFCLKPKHTCQSLRKLYYLRCQEMKDSFHNSHPTEKECKNRLHEYRVYVEICGSDDNYLEFAKSCITHYSSNKIILSYVNGPAGKHTHHSKKLHTGRGDS